MIDRPVAEDFEHALKQPYPAKQSEMAIQPQSELRDYRPADKLKGKVALITGGDSGIGRSVALAYALEGAKVAILYNQNDGDAQTTRELIEARGATCLVIRMDVRDRASCGEAVERTLREYGGLNILVNNAAFQKTQSSVLDITEKQLRRTFETNLFGYIFMIQAALPHLKRGDAIIDTGSIVGDSGHPILIDYAASKGGVHSLTKSLALQFGRDHLDNGVRVNCVTPGPVWTPNIPGTMPLDEIHSFGHEVALGRPGQPEELAPAYVYLACEADQFVRHRQPAVRHWRTVVSVWRAPRRACAQEEARMKIDVNGVAHHVVMRGRHSRARTVAVFVFLHGFGGSSALWTEVMEELGERAPSLAFDLRGFGETQASGNFGVADYAADVVALVDALGLENYILVGHSMGGKIALAAAARRPAGLRGLALVAPSPPTPEPMSDARRAELLSGYGSRDAAFDIIARIARRPLAPALVARMIGDHLRSSPEAWRAWLERGSREDISTQLNDIDAPVGVLGGRYDPVMPRVLLQREVADRLAAPLALISDAGHLLPLESPHVLVSALRAFLPEADIAARACRGPSTRALLQTDLVTEPTRRALTARLAFTPPRVPRFFSAPNYEVLLAACARLAPRRAAARVAAAIDARLADDEGDGWRYDDMPPDREAYRRGLQGLDETARAMAGADFILLDPEEQDRVLSAMQRGDAPGDVWRTLNAARFFEELSAESAALYFSEAEGQDEIGYVGFADAHGWSAIGLDAWAPGEPRPPFTDADATAQR
jgi:NAD(P)-dependent dehydrogenase (short-subunit alcohol dehydrogenase family)/pimeloyl-ACP methyl ester carboxylesterase